MNKPNFTPGPWSADKWAPGYTVSAPKSHFSICHLQDCNNEEANARLIAAAPALYAALDRLLVAFCEARELATREPMADGPLVTSLQCAGGAEYEAKDALALVDSPNAETGAEIGKEAANV